MSNAAALITGMGPVSAIGTGRAAFEDALFAGQSGLRRARLTAFRGRGCAVAAEVDDPPFAPLQMQDPRPRAVELALRAAKLAWDDAGRDGDRSKVGVVVGTGLGNLDLVEASVRAIHDGARVSPVTAFRAFAHNAACEIASALDLGGPLTTVSSGCNSGADALGVALDWIRLGRADAVVVGGTEAELCPAFLDSMTAARGLATRWNDEPTRASRPFDTRRDGNVPGEGAAFLVLERDVPHRRDVAVAALRGFANRSSGRRQAYDAFAPSPSTAPAVEALRAALADAGLGIEQVDAVSANGSSSVFYDSFEEQVLRGMLGEHASRVPVHSIKSMLGQTGAVTPVLQAIAACLSLQRGCLPPTTNCDDPLPAFGLDLVRDRARPASLRNILAHSIGFGGFYFAALAYGRVEAT